MAENNGHLYYGLPSGTTFDDYAWAALVADRGRLDRVLAEWPSDWRDKAMDNIYAGRLATLNGATVEPINGSLTDAVIDRNGDLLLLQASARPGQRWLLQRIGTTLSQQVARALFVGGVEGLLDTDRQLSFAEGPTPITVRNSNVEDAVNAGEVDFNGAFGVYYREIFFHIPLLIARQLQSQGNYREAKRWYEYLFNPTSSEVIEPDSSLTTAENEARARDRNWRYSEFRGLGLPQLRAALTDAHAIATYRADPFNPHAIARLRLSAYQKYVVMAYVDNLLDWADHLFSGFQRESINEAMVLYQTAKDILGPRPAELGACEAADSTRTYEGVRSSVKAGSDFLAELEHLVWINNGSVGKPGRPGLGWIKDKIRYKYGLDITFASDATWRATLAPGSKAAGIKVIGGSHVDGRRTSVELVEKDGATKAFASIDVGPAAIEKATAEPFVTVALAKNAGAAAEAVTVPGLTLPLSETTFAPGTTIFGFDPSAGISAQGHLRGC